MTFLNNNTYLNSTNNMSNNNNLGNNNTTTKYYHRCSKIKKMMGWRTRRAMEVMRKRTKRRFVVAMPLLASQAYSG
jgi:hypothetical protein